MWRLRLTPAFGGTIPGWRASKYVLQRYPNAPIIVSAYSMKECELDEDCVREGFGEDEIACLGSGGKRGVFWREDGRRGERARNSRGCVSFRVVRRTVSRKIF